MLRYLPPGHDPNVLVDASTGDDAAVVRLSENRALVLTTDFFTPIVDDPYAWGQIAATNALSDVYAMGGRPLYCLSLVAWPRETLPLDLLGRVIEGAGEVVQRAGCLIVGGHSIDDPEPKFGLVAVGDVDPRHMTTNAAAAPGDALVLTKPIGTGIIATAIKRGLAAAETIEAAVRSMTTLNADAADAAREAGVRAATDVTGFGLLGHLHAMLKASGCAAEIHAGEVPQLPDLRALIGKGCVPGGTERNLASLEHHVTFDRALDRTDKVILADAQTSGGLLLAVRTDAMEHLLDGLKAKGTPAAAVIGRVVPGEPGRILVQST